MERDERTATALLGVAVAVLLLTGGWWWARSAPPPSTDRAETVVPEAWRTAADAELTLIEARPIAYGGPFAVTEPGPYINGLDLPAGGYDLATVCVGTGEGRIVLLGPAGRHLLDAPLGCSTERSTTYFPITLTEGQHVDVRTDALEAPIAVGWRLSDPGQAVEAWVAQAEKLLPPREALARQALMLDAGARPEQPVRVPTTTPGEYMLEAVCVGTGQIAIDMRSPEVNQGFDVTCDGAVGNAVVVVRSREAPLFVFVRRARGVGALAWHLVRSP